MRYVMFVLLVVFVADASVGAVATPKQGLSYMECLKALRASEGK